MALVDDFLATRFGGGQAEPKVSATGDEQQDLAMSIIQKKYPASGITTVTPTEKIFGKIEKEKEVTNTQAPPNIDRVDYSAQALAKYVLDNGITDLNYKQWWNDAPMKAEAWKLINKALGRHENYIADTVLKQGKVPPKNIQILQLIGDVLDPNSYLHPNTTEKEAAARFDTLKKMGELEEVSMGYAEELKVQEGGIIPGFVMETFAKQVGTLRYGISETSEGKIFTGVPAMVFGITPAGLTFNAATSLPVIGKPIEEVANFAFNTIPDSILEHTPGLNMAPQGFKDMMKLGIQIVEGVILHKVYKTVKEPIVEGIKGAKEKILTKDVTYDKTEVFKALQEINGVKNVGAKPQVVDAVKQLIIDAGEGVKQTQMLRASWKKGITIKEARSFVKWFNGFFKNLKKEDVTPTFAGLLTDGKKAAKGTVSLVKFTEKAREVMTPEIRQTPGMKIVTSDFAVGPVPQQRLSMVEPPPKAVKIGEPVVTPAQKAVAAPAIKPRKTKEPVKREVTNKEIDKIVQELKQGDISEERYNEMQNELIVAKETVNEHPAKSLVKYVLKSTGRLPEFTQKETKVTKAGKIIKTNEFERHGDQLARNLGFEDSEAARDAVDDYLDLRNKINEIDTKLKEVRRTRKDIKAIEQKRYEEPIVPEKGKFKVKDVGLLETVPEALGPKTGISKVAKSIRAKALEQKLIASAGEIAGYDKIQIKEQSEMATNLINNNFGYARDILNGRALIPEKLNPVFLIKGMEELAITTRDGGLMAEVMKSPLITETSIAAQTLRAAREREPDSATAKMKEIQAARKEAAEKKAHGRNEKEVKAKMKKDAKAKAKKYKPTKRTWDALIDELTC